MRTLYFLRVLVVSVEALVLATSWVCATYFHGALQGFAASLALNEEVLKYLLLLPAGVAAWVANECRMLLQEDKETIRTLTSWPDYWKLKAHVWVSLIYAALFAGISMIPWTAKSGISTGFGLLIFLTSLVGQLYLAIAVYAARIRAKEILAHMP